MSAAGKLADLDVNVVGPDLIRLDYIASTPPNHDKTDRHTAVVDLRTARSMVILLVRAIEQAEIDEARAAKTKRKKK